MSEYKVTLAGALPKGDANGFDDYTISKPLFRSRADGTEERPRVALIIYGIRNADHGKDGINTVKIETLRAEPILTDTGRRLAEQMLADEYAARTGRAMLPYELTALSKSAFADLPRSTEEIDEKESREQDMMSPTDELRRHLERVHGTEEAHLLTAEAAEEKHRADHDGDVLGPLAHDVEWTGWTRADLEAAEFEAENDDSEPYGENGAVAEDESEPAETNTATAEYSMQANADSEAGLFRSPVGQ